MNADSILDLTTEIKVKVSGCHLSEQAKETDIKRVAKETTFDCGCDAVDLGFYLRDQGQSQSMSP